MSLEHPCFISYRHNRGDRYKRIIIDLYDALAEELGNFISDKEIFIDKRIQGGEYIDSEIAEALCKSACMIMAFTPTYFEYNHLYCAREFRAMEKIERKRFSSLGYGINNRGFIIPVILRGEEDFPVYIKANRKYISFNNYRSSTSKTTNILYRDYFEEILKIARYVYECFEFLEENWDASMECREFNLPAESEVKPWVDSIRAPKKRFPGRGGVSQ